MLVRVLYNNSKYDFIKPSYIDKLINSGQIKSFLRSEGWVMIGVDPIRGRGGTYEGSERRKSENIHQNLNHYYFRSFIK
ncbi:MAG: hypothetical protein KAQ85_11205 [Thermodesulfovibrionia bacterium]|nr:hypothetical protein [Thermodesulfovibrionia bacterium]MCK5286706.1 hypothetical protein [Thermodesulfovibrionia bacterium]MCK5426286.1 hypothetical protein [Thermodesulfovibrionia bacterium]MCK5512580.1 hypothetical protein [Thermodesulfovibrionia bacterium]